MAVPEDNTGTTQPSRFSVTEALRDGASIMIRAQRSEDADALVGIFDRAGAQSRYNRFFAAKKGISEGELAHFMNVDFTSHVALVAVIEEAGGPHIVGAGRYIVTQPGAAEIAFGVDDAHQGMGIASALIRHLAAIARASGLHTLTADVLSGNSAMLKVFGKCGLKMAVTREQGVVHVALGLE